MKYFQKWRVLIALIIGGLTFCMNWAIGTNNKEDILNDDCSQSGEECILIGSNGNQQSLALYNDCIGCQIVSPDGTQYGGRYSVCLHFFDTHSGRKLINYLTVKGGVNYPEKPNGLEGSLLFSSPHWGENSEFAENGFLALELVLTSSFKKDRKFSDNIGYYFEPSDYEKSAGLSHFRPVCDQFSQSAEIISFNKNKLRSLDVIPQGGIRIKDYLKLKNRMNPTENDCAIHLSTACLSGLSASGGSVNLALKEKSRVIRIILS